MQAARALQQQQADSCNALLVTATAWEEDGTGMELSQLLDRIRTQCDRLSLTGLNQVPDDRHPGLAAAPNQTPCSAAGPSRFGATLRPRAHGGSLPQVRSVPLPSSLPLSLFPSFHPSLSLSFLSSSLGSLPPSHTLIIALSLLFPGNAVICGKIRRVGLF